MSVPDLEARLRRLKLAEPPDALEGRMLAAAASMGRLRRRFRMALAAMAASMLLAVTAGRLSGAGTSVPAARPAPSVPSEILAIDPALARRAELLAWIAPMPAPSFRATHDALRKLSQGELP